MHFCLCVKCTTKKISGKKSAPVNTRYAYRDVMYEILLVAIGYDCYSIMHTREKIIFAFTVHIICSYDSELERSELN